MKTYQLISLLSFLTLLISCDTEDVSNNPELEGTYLCEAHIKITWQDFPYVEDEECIYLSGNDASENYVQIIDSIIQLSFDSENVFHINNFEDLDQINVSEDLSISSPSSSLLQGSFHANDSLSFDLSVIKPAGNINNPYTVYNIVTDHYYCVKQ